MFLSKRIAKLRRLSSVQQSQEVEKPTIIKDTKKAARCRFMEIPPPAKYINIPPIYSIYGDIPFMYLKGELVAEISLYNESKNYKDITITEVDEQKIITIKPTLKTDKDIPQWTQFVDTLNQSGDTQSQEWAKNIKSYCHTYSKVMQRQSRKKMKSEPRKKFFYQVTDETNLRSKNLFNHYPCLKLKFRIKNHQNQLKEILLNESLVKEMGYSMEGFATLVLQEGLPQMMPYDNPLAASVAKALIKNYFTIEDNGHEVEELTCPLLMKNNFAKNITFKTYFLMNYEDSVFGMDLIVAVTGMGEPYLLPKKALNQELNEDFVQSMSSKEGEFDYFISNFYDQPFMRNYTNLSKICTLKEIKYTEPEETNTGNEKFSSPESN